MIKNWFAFFEEFFFWSRFWSWGYMFKIQEERDKTREKFAKVLQKLPKKKTKNYFALFCFDEFFCNRFWYWVYMFKLPIGARQKFAKVLQKLPKAWPKKLVCIIFVGRIFSQQILKLGVHVQTSIGARQNQTVRKIVAKASESMIKTLFCFFWTNFFATDFEAGMSERLHFDLASWCCLAPG